jgi:2-polyprenyl-3-methyl-5-hydroxy-6-metoxy-1,4-benzoquinol methylase
VEDLSTKSAVPNGKDSLYIDHQWGKGHRDSENAPFFEMAFDYVAGRFGSAGSGLVLDAGCGVGSHSERLARRGFRVLGLDLSPRNVRDAARNLNDKGLGQAIKLAASDVCLMPLGDGCFQRVMCWGVLMHVPDLERSLKELARVLAPGGHLVLSESNMSSLQSRSRLFLKRILGVGASRALETPAGIEYWSSTANGSVLTRQSNIGWIIETLGGLGCALEDRRAGQFTVLFTDTASWWARRVMHAFNNAWFRHVRVAWPAAGNVMVFRKLGRR